MPEAPVDKEDEPCASEDKVGANAHAAVFGSTNPVFCGRPWPHLNMSPPSGDVCLTENSDHGHLGRGVAATSDS